MNNSTNQNKLSKQEKESINYFTKTDTLKYVGGGLLIAGLFCLWIGFRLGVIGFILALIGTPLGLLLFLFGASGRATDEDMEASITSKMAGLIIEIDNNRHYQLRLLKHLKEHTIEGYHYYGTGIMLKKMKNGSLRTSEFGRAKVRILSDSLYIVSRKISLINDDVENDTYEIFYDNIKNIEIIREQNRVIFNKTTFFTKPCYFHIVTDDQDIKLPIVDAVTSDELVDIIKRQMSIYNDNKSKA